MCLALCKVCKQWRDVARLAWSTRRRIIIFGCHIKSLDEHLLTTIFTSKHMGHALTHFELNRSWLETREDPSLAALAQHCPNLEHLNLWQVILCHVFYSKSEETTSNDLTDLLLCRIRLSDSSLIEVAKGCRKLKTLILRSCISVSDAALAELFTYCTQLSCLELLCCDQITGKCLEAGGTVALRRLYIQACSQVRTNSH